MTRRGDVVIAGERSRLGGKPRPWLVVQSDAFNPTHATITVCMISASTQAGGLFRVPIVPDPSNGLREPSTIMVDVLLSLSRRSIDEVAGSIDLDTMATVDDAMRRWLDL